MIQRVTGDGSQESSKPQSSVPGRRCVTHSAQFLADDPESGNGLDGWDNEPLHGLDHRFMERDAGSQWPRIPPATRERPRRSIRAALARDGR